MKQYHWYHHHSVTLELPHLAFLNSIQTHYKVVVRAIVNSPMKTEDSSYYYDNVLLYCPSLFVYNDVYLHFFVLVCVHVFCTSQWKRGHSLLLSISDPWGPSQQQQKKSLDKMLMGQVSLFSRVPIGERRRPQTQNFPVVVELSLKH